MAYRIETHETVSDGLARSAAAQLDRAVRELSEGIAGDPVEAVHAARKAVKRERSLLRLVRGSMPRSERRRQNRTLRDASRGLAGARDAEVMIETLDDLAERYAGQVPRAAFAAVRDRLAGDRDVQRGQLVGSALGDRAVGELGSVRVRLEGWTLERGGWAAIEDGLRRTYADGRTAMRAAGRSPGSARRWHEWRKRVKDLWYHDRLLAAGAPAIAGQASDAHRLADLLGDDHDLAVLDEALCTGAADAPVDTRALRGLVDQRRTELQSAALALGERVYGESPGAYVRRMRGAWRAGRRLGRLTAGEDPVALAAAPRVADPS